MLFYYLAVMFQVLFYLFGICSLIQLGYWLLIKSSILFYRPLIPQEQFKKSFSIVIAAKNEYENLLELIPLLLKQEATTFEIIIVNDQSTDQTESLLQEFESKHSNFHYKTIKETPLNFNSKKYALDTGIRMAKYDCVLLTDADCLPSSPQWAKKMVSQQSDEKEIVLGISHYTYKKGFLNLIIRYETLQTMISYLGFALVGMPYMGVGRNLCYTKTAFIKAEGFSGIEKIVGGDDDLLIQKIAKKKVAICIDKEAICCSKPKKKLSSYLKQKKRHLSVGRYYLPKFKFLLALEASSNMFFYGLFLFFIINDNLSMIVFTVFLSKLITASFFSYKIKIRVHAKISLLEILVMDFFHSFITTTLGVYSVLVKHKKWS